MTVTMPGQKPGPRPSYLRPGQVILRASATCSALVPAGLNEALRVARPLKPQTRGPIRAGSRITQMGVQEQETTAEVATSPAHIFLHLH